MRHKIVILILLFICSMSIPTAFAIVGTPPQNAPQAAKIVKPQKISKWKLLKQLKKHRKRTRKVDDSSLVVKLWLWLLAGFILLYPLGFLFPGAAGTLATIAYIGVGVLLGSILLFYVVVGLGLLIQSEKKSKREYRNDGYYDSEGNYHYY